jgi:hypothetical protein
MSLNASRTRRVACPRSTRWDDETPVAALRRLRHDVVVAEDRDRYGRQVEIERPMSDYEYSHEAGEMVLRPEVYMAERDAFLAECAAADAAADNAIAGL